MQRLHGKLRRCSQLSRYLVPSWNTRPPQQDFKPSHLASFALTSHSPKCTSLAALRRSLCTEASYVPLSTISEPLAPIPVPSLPSQIPTDRFALYELLGTAGTGPDNAGYTTVVAVHGPEEDMLREGDSIEGACGGLFAVVAVAGGQHKVTVDDVLYTTRKLGEVNSEVVLDEVLMIGTEEYSIFGRPFVPGAVVTATVEEQTHSGSVIVAKYKKRKGYRRVKEHRQPITRFRINEVKFAFPDADMFIPLKIPHDPLRPARSGIAKGL